MIALPRSQADVDRFEAGLSVVLKRALCASLPVVVGLVQGLRLAGWLFRRTTKESNCRTSLMACSEERSAGKISRPYELRRTDA